MRRRKIALLVALAVGVLLALLLPQIGGDYYVYILGEGGTSSAAPSSTRKPLLPNAMNLAKVYAEAFAATRA